MRQRFWFVPLTGSLVLALAFTLHADAVKAKAPANWGGRPAQAADVTSLPDPGAGGQVNGVVPPILTDQWLKMKVKCKGKTVDAFTSLTASKSLSFTVYMQLIAHSMGALTGPGDGGGAGVPTYDYIVWVEDGDGNWSPQSYQGTLYTDGLDANGQTALVVNSFLGFELYNGSVASVQSATLTIKVDNEGVLKSAKYKTISSDILQSFLPAQSLSLGVDGFEYFGAMTITGSLVAVDKLPFNPEI